MVKPRTSQIEVSLIICGYNAAATLASALDSASAQTLGPLEILCVNDGSTDGTAGIFRSYAEKDSRIKVFDHTGNKGLLAARRTGVDHASGKYVMFLDADDALRPEACLELARMMKVTGSDLIQFGTELVYASGEEREAREKIESDYFSAKWEGTLCGSDAIVSSCFLKREFPWNVWSKIWKTDLARRVYSHVPDDMTVVMAEDAFAFFLAASMAEKLAFSEKKYYLYSVGTGVSARKDPKYEEKSLEVFSKLIKPYADRHCSAVGRRAADELGRSLRFFLSRRLLDTDPREPYREIIDREFRIFGPALTALVFTENWRLFGVHPLKTVFLGFAGRLPSRRAETIRRIGVVGTGAEIGPSLSRLIGLLREARYEVRIFVRNVPGRPVEKTFPGCRVEFYPDDREEMTSFFAGSAVREQNDAFVLSYDAAPDYDLTGFLLFHFRFFCGKPCFAFPEGRSGPLHCHDRIYLSAADCVLGISGSAARLFGDIGIFDPAMGTAGRLKKIISAFEKDSAEGPCGVLAARRRMQTTAAGALAALGFAGFGNNTGNPVPEKKIAAAGKPVSAADYRLLRESGYFDDGYYREQFPGCAIDDTIIHFCSVGVHKLASPSAIFDSKRYYLANPDLYPGFNPVIHYLRHGIAEKRNTGFPAYDIILNSGCFDETLYRKEHGAELGPADPLTHYLLVGWKKGYLPSERFVGQYYSDFYFELERVSMNPLYHYVCWGKNEGRCSFPLHPRFEEYFPEGFDPETFRQRQGKYLIAVHQLDFTGVPILAKMVAEIFAEEKSAAVITPMDGPLRDACLKAGIPVLVDSDFFVRGEQASFYRESGFGVCLFNTLVLIRTFLRTAGTIPSVLWIHDNLSRSCLPEAVRRRIECAPTVFATSRNTLEVVREYNPAVRHLPYPVKDMCGHHKTALPERIRFGVFGVYSDRKGQDLAVEAFKQLPPELKSRAELLLIGDAALPEFAEKIKALAAGEEHIRFVPAEKDPAAYHRLYEELEVQICPSRTDPMPLVVFDGMMHGCPEILSDTVGQSEFIRNDENGYVFPAGDVTALRDCMARVLENPERFTRMSRASRETFLDNFEFGQAAGVIRGVLDEVKKYI